MYTILFTGETFDQSALKRVLIERHDIYSVYKCCNHGHPYIAYNDYNNNSNYMVSKTACKNAPLEVPLERNQRGINK